MYVAYLKILMLLNAPLAKFLLSSRATPVSGGTVSGVYQRAHLGKKSKIDSALIISNYGNQFLGTTRQVVDPMESMNKELN